MENYIRRVVITDLFEIGNNYKIEILEGVNCVFGGNGTGKTTVINLIVNSFNVDLDVLARVPFGSISIFLASSGKKRAQKLFTLEKKSLSDGSLASMGAVELSYSQENYEAEKFLINVREFSERIVDDRYADRVVALKSRLQAKIKLTHVPLLRMHDAELFGLRDERDEFLQSALRHRKISPLEISEIMDPSVRVLKSLQQQFINEANENRKIITQKLEALKSTIIEKVMIDDSLERDVRRAFSKVSKSISSDFNDTNVSAYANKLRGANISVPDNKVQDHFNIWKKLNVNIRKEREHIDELTEKKEVAEKINAAQRKYSESYFSMFVMTHFHERFLSIVSDVESMQAEKNQLTKKFQEYEYEINSYFNPKKTFQLSDDGKFSVYSSTRRLRLSDLSSGEKHILTILGRAALCGDEGAVFVADEPELSLHLDWQRKILPSIMRLSPKSQILVATHSPAIYAQDAAEIDLESCIV